MADTRVRTHSLGVMCAVCKDVLEPDDCCKDQPHGHGYQEPNEWAARTWPDHPCLRFMPPGDDVPEGEPFAWTPDDVMKRGVEEFKRLWPDKWEAWLRWCESESANETHVIPPGDGDG